MAKSLSERITESRLLLKNPYAYLSDSDGFSALPLHENLAKSSSDTITKSRKLLQDPYAYLDEFDGFSALSNDSNMQIDSFARVSREGVEKTLHAHTEIEQKARNLHKRMWQNRNQIWSKTVPSNPIDMLDPVVALEFCGYRCDLVETLGQFQSDGKLIEVAGIIDKPSAKVRISRQFSQSICNFTAAHELGHALLHQTSGLHRDRPLDGTIISRDAIEMEADKFATFFLMPRKLVKTTFEKLFITDKFSLNEETAFALGLGGFMELNEKVKNLRQLSRMLASVEYYNGRHFISLANQFRVSVETMSIRLEELELLAL